MGSELKTAPPLASAVSRIDAWIHRWEAQLIEYLQQLVRIPSENLPPEGGERACQLQIADWLRQIDVRPDVYDLTEVDALSGHPEFYPGRNYRNRPNVNARIKGSGDGRSLILSGHIDTVPADTPVRWKHDPFAGELRNGQLFGRGAWDMKAGCAANVVVLRMLKECGIRLAGDLIFESVVDEEFGGANGTLAARLRGYNADAAVIGEPTSLRICPAQRGGRTLHIVLTGNGGILASDRPRARVVDQLTHVLASLKEFQQRREARVAIDPYYANSVEPFAVWVTNIATGRWGWTQPISIPEICRLEVYWQAMPDETEEEIEAEFGSWWTDTVDGRPDLFDQPPHVERPMRWLPGCSIPKDSPLITEFSLAAESCELTPIVEGMDAPSDMYIFQKCFNTPAIMWGAKGGRAHQADEYVDIDSLKSATRALAHFVCRWCRVQNVE